MSTPTPLSKTVAINSETYVTTDDTRSLIKQKLDSENAQSIYHGSSLLFDCPKCCHSIRINHAGVIDWEGDAVFATFDRRIALIYTANRGVEGYNTGVDLKTELSKDKPLVIIVEGGRDETDALNKIFGTNAESEPAGYIYRMNQKFFHHEAGLGVMERISRNPEKPGFLLGVEKINRRVEIDTYIKQGLMKVTWSPTQTQAKLVTPAPVIFSQINKQKNDSALEKAKHKKSRCCCF